MENEVQEGWINTGFVAHARAGGPCKHSPPDQHTSRAKVSSLLSWGERSVMCIIVGWTMHYFVSVVLMLIVRNSKIGYDKYVKGRRKIN